MSQRALNITYTASILVIGICLGWILWGSQWGLVGTDHSGMMEEEHVSSMEVMMDEMLMELEGKENAEFEKAFLEQMIAHHQGAVVMSQQVLAKSTRPELLTFARNIISAQQAEIKSMQLWLGRWFPNAN